MQITSTQFIRSILLGIVFLLGLGFGYMDSHGQETAEGKQRFTSTDMMSAKQPWKSCPASKKLETVGKISKRSTRSIMTRLPLQWVKWKRP